MHNPANQPQFTLSVQGLEHDLQVLDFIGHEAITSPTTSTSSWSASTPSSTSKTSTTASPTSAS